MSYLLLQAETKPEGIKPVQLRKKNLVPAVLYGENENSIPICIQERIIDKTLASGAKVFEVQIDGKQKFLANIDKVQRNPLTRRPIHIYFRRMSQNTEAKLTVPLHFEGRPEGELQGGLTVHQLDTITIMGLPKDLPEFITINIANLQVGHGVHVKDIVLPAGIRLADAHDGNKMAVTCNIQKAQEETTTAAPVEGAAEGTPATASTEAQAE